MKRSIPKRPASAAARHRYADDSSDGRRNSITPERCRSPTRSPRTQARNLRSRSVGPTELKQGLTRAKSDVGENPEMLMVSRDSSGGHRVGPVVAGNGNGNGFGNGNKGNTIMSRARMAMTPDRLLPDKLTIARQSSMESDCSSPMSSDRSSVLAQNRKPARRTTSIDTDSDLTTPDEPPKNVIPERKRTLSESICIDSSHLDEIEDPQPNAELNQHMELLFSEYMKIERSSSKASSRSTSPGPMSQTREQLPVHITKKDLSKVKSRLADYIKGKKDAPASTARPQTPRKGGTAGTTPMGFRRPASATGSITPRKSSLAGSRLTGSQDNILEQSSRSRGGSRGTSPTPTRRKLPAAPMSVPSSPMTDQPRRPSSATARRNPGATNSTMGRMVRSQSVTRVEMTNERPTTPTSSRVRPTTPTQSRARPTTPSKSAFRAVNPQERTVTTPRRPSSAAAGRVSSRENLLDTNPRARPEAKTSMSRSKSRDDVLGAAAAPQYPWRTRTPTKTSPTAELSVNTTEQELNNTLAEIRDFVSKTKDAERPSELSLLAPETGPESPKPEFAAKPRMAKKQEGKTRIPMPISSKEASLKRYDSGVDINNTDSPSENSIHEALPWLQYFSTNNLGQGAEPEYF